MSTDKPTCTNCNDEMWVCENHPDVPWQDGDAMCCEKADGSYGCGAGAPCKLCNPCDRDNPPKWPPGMRVVFDKDGWRH